MAILYQIIIYGYGFLIRIAALFNRKARMWVRGRKDLYISLQQHNPQDHSKTVWVHCASLGEFEQGRPVMEKLREEVPDMFLLLTFFSPSGYEVRKDYPGADQVMYLPLDTPRNARRFLNLVKPDLVVFVKYEYWYFFLKALHERTIPVFLISAIFRPGQFFFKKLGRFYLGLLHFFTGIFVQDNESKALLEQHNIDRVIVSGDTRYDRVVSIAAHPVDIPVARSFTGEFPVVVAGSTWPGDEEILTRYILEHQRPFKWIIAPHEIDTHHLSSLCKTLGHSAVLFSSVKDHPDPDVQVLIIDNVGMLSSLYALADITYIGGGFGKGIHNTLEAAVYGVPVLFGPGYHKFREACEMVAMKTAHPVTGYPEFSQQLNHLYDHEELRKNEGKKNRAFIQRKTGATVQIVNNLLTII